MTREQIEQLTGRELDAEVERRVFGRNAVMLSVHQTEEGDEVVRLDADGDVPTWAVLERDTLHPLPRLSTDIGAAFEVVEEMRRRGWRFQLTELPDDWEALFSKGTQDVIWNDTEVATSICKAALLARMGEEKA